MDSKDLQRAAIEADQEDRPAEAIELFKAASKLDPSISAFAYFRLADNLRIICRYDEAEKVYATIEVGDVPLKKKWIFHLHKAQLYVAKGDMQSAIACFEQAIESDPMTTIPYVYLGATYAEMRKPEKAIQVLLRALNAKGDRDEVYLNLGYNYRTLGQYALAKEALTNALELTPDYPEAKRALEDVTAALKVTEMLGDS